MFLKERLQISCTGWITGSTYRWWHFHLKQTSRTLRGARADWMHRGKCFSLPNVWEVSQNRPQYCRTCELERELWSATTHNNPRHQVIFWCYVMLFVLTIIISQHVRSRPWSQRTTWMPAQQMSWGTLPHADRIVKLFFSWRIVYDENIQ